MAVMLAKICVSLAGCLLSLLILKGLIRPRLSIGSMILLALVLRVGGLLILHGPLNFDIPADTKGYYEHATLVLHGEVPSRDFTSPYAFGFTYLMAAPVAICNSPLSILAMCQVLELIGALLFFKSLGGVLDDIKARQSCLLYLVNPIVLVCLWLEGQDESLMVLAVGITMWLISRKGFVLAGAVGALLLNATKILTLGVIWPMFCDKRWKSLLLFVSLNAVVVAVILSLGAKPLCFEYDRFGGDSDNLALRVTSGNLWFPVSKASATTAGSFVPPLLTMVGLSILAGTLWFFHKRMTPKMLLLYGVSVFFLIFMVFYRMTYAQYLAAAIPCMLVLGLSGGMARWTLIPTVGWCTFMACNATTYYRGFITSNWPVRLTPIYWAYQTAAIITGMVVLGIFIYYMATNLRRQDLATSTADDNQTSSA